MNEIFYVVLSINTETGWAGNDRQLHRTREEANGRAEEMESMLGAEWKLLVEKLVLPGAKR